MTKSGDSACQIVLVPAGEVAAREVNKIAADVMSREFADGVESFRLAPMDEKAEFEAVKFAGGRGLAAGFAVQQKHVERVTKSVSS